MAKQKQETQPDVVGACFLTAFITAVIALGIGYGIFHEEVKDEWRVSPVGAAVWVGEGNYGYSSSIETVWQACHTRSFRYLYEQNCNTFKSHDDAVAFAKTKGFHGDEIVK